MDKKIKDRVLGDYSRFGILAAGYKEAAENTMVGYLRVCGDDGDEEIPRKNGDPIWTSGDACAGESLFPHAYVFGSISISFCIYSSPTWTEANSHYLISGPGFPSFYRILIVLSSSPRPNQPQRHQD